jgi:serine/threonine protein kinase
VLCYEMATGKAPFENQGRQDETYERIMKSEFEYPDHLSSGIRDFIDRLLVRNPKKRMSLEQALQHEWLTENSKGGLTVSREIYNSYSCI